ALMIAKNLKSLIFGSLLLIAISVSGQQAGLLQSGPMVGYADMQEVMLWVQTSKSAKVQFAYHEPGKEQNLMLTAEKTTSPEEAFTAKLIADKVEPGKTYIYRLLINGEFIKLPYPTQFETQEIWKWRGDAPDFSFLTGSCAYINQTEHDRPGDPYGGEYQIFENMAGHDTEFMLWLGDNVYLREPDWNTKTGIQNRYTHTRSIAEMQELLGSRSNYAIWDDHDYGPNNSDKGFINKHLTHEAFDLFWANPTTGVHGIEGAITAFQWADLDFFLLDNRWYRDANGLEKEDKTILGQKQLEWLFDNLLASQASFKIIALGGQFLSDVGLYETYSANGFNDERLKIIDFIKKHHLKNVVFITGDVHFSEVSKYAEADCPTIWDLTFSTMSAGPNKRGHEWDNSFRVLGKVYTDRNFGLIKVSGPLSERKLEVYCYDTNDQLQYEVIIEKE
ncbi:MAG: alkaline phosphatase family protein, partial [Bacteroidetes bacterium]|nr:alkaline phosphatase family protein [Bacteroidota bacterium]